MTHNIVLEENIFSNEQHVCESTIQKLHIGPAAEFSDLCILPVCTFTWLLICTQSGIVTTYYILICHHFSI